MTTTLERLTSLRLMQALVAAAVAALFIVAAAGMASADGNYGGSNYGGSSNYPSPNPPGSDHPPRTPRVVGTPSFLPVTGGDALGLAALGVTVAGLGTGLVLWSRKRSAATAGG